MKSSWRRRLLGIAFGCFLSFLILEAGVRCIEPKRVLRSYFETPDRVLHHKFIPGAQGHYRSLEYSTSYDINSLGLRDRELPQKKPAGMRRILVLGDSFTEGIGVEAAQSIPSRLQARVDGDGLGKEWQVVNGGVASYSPLLEYLYLKNGGLELEPDLVVLMFDLSDVWDDFQYTALARFDAQGKPLAVDADPEPPKKSWPVEALISVKDFIKEHVRLYNFMRRSIGRIIESRRTHMYSGDVRTDKYAMLRDGYQPTDERDWELTHKYILMIRDLLKERGIDFLLTVYPYGLQVSPREWSEGRVFWGFEKNRVYATKPQDKLAEFAKKNGIRVLDMSEDFKQAAHTKYPLYLDIDGHMQAAGCDLAASILHRFLVPELKRPKASERTEMHTSAPAVEADKPR